MPAPRVLADRKAVPAGQILQRHRQAALLTGAVIVLHDAAQPQAARLQTQRESGHEVVDLEPGGIGDGGQQRHDDVIP